MTATCENQAARFKSGAGRCSSSVLKYPGKREWQRLSPRSTRGTRGETGQPRAASINRRISAIEASRPMKIASPIRKCPMFSSRTSGSAATGATVS